MISNTLSFDQTENSLQKAILNVATRIEWKCLSVFFPWAENDDSFILSDAMEAIIYKIELLYSVIHADRKLKFLHIAIAVIDEH